MGLMQLCNFDGLLATQCAPPDTSLKTKKGDRIFLIGNNLGSRMMTYGYFETEMQLRYPDRSEEHTSELQSL